MNIKIRYSQGMSLGEVKREALRFFLSSMYNDGLEITVEQAEENSDAIIGQFVRELNEVFAEKFPNLGIVVGCVPFPMLGHFTIWKARESSHSLHWYPSYDKVGEILETID